jgi:hypothetical protein
LMADQATIRTADGAAILIDQRNNMPKQVERQGGWSELAETGDGPHLWRGPSTRKKGRHRGGGPCLRRVAVWKDRAGGAAAPSRERERRRTEHRDDRMQLGVDRAAGAALIETREMEEERPGGP